MAVEVKMTNHEKAIWNAKTTGIRGLAPILTEIYDAQTALEERVAITEKKQSALIAALSKEEQMRFLNNLNG